ncbi:hypothetical protein Tco_0300403 [Tanacetum coccineum]
MDILAQFPAYLKEDNQSIAQFMLDKKELSLTLHDFRTIFQLPQANDNNHNSLVPPPSYTDMVQFYKQQLGIYNGTEDIEVAEVFGLDVPLTQSQPSKSTQGTHRTPSALRRSTRLTPPAPSEAARTRENVELVNKHLASEEIETIEVVIPVNVNEEEDEITDEMYELKRREKGKIVESYKDVYTYFLKTQEERFLSRKSFDTLADHLQEVMVQSLPTMVDTHIKEQVKSKFLSRYHKLHVTFSIIPLQGNQDDPHDDDAHLEGENSVKRQKTFEYEA